ncbi:MAG: hypothetical protein KC425_27700 [Anaerolineales bacterium]|nr:hypothetical protein [Anaerolineales bacterium]
MAGAFDRMGTAVSTPAFTAGPAEACGLATSRAGSTITDTYAWCKDVDLVIVDQQIYLPLVLQP